MENNWRDDVKPGDWDDVGLFINLADLEDKISKKLESSSKISEDCRKKLEDINDDMINKENLHFDTTKENLDELVRSLEKNHRELKELFQEQNKLLEQLERKSELPTEKMKNWKSQLEKDLKAPPPKFLSEKVRKALMDFQKDSGENEEKLESLLEYIDDYKNSYEKVGEAFKSAKRIIQIKQNEIKHSLAELIDDINITQKVIEGPEGLKRYELRKQLTKMKLRLEDFQKNINKDAESYKKTTNNILKLAFNYLKSSYLSAKAGTKIRQIKKHLGKTETKKIDWLRKKVEKAKKDTDNLTEDNSTEDNLTKNEMPRL